MSTYTLRHPELAALCADHLDPRLRAALREGPAALGSLADPVAPDLFALRILSVETCTSLLAELDAFEDWAARHGVEPERPNSMNYSGVILADIGLQGSMTWLRDAVLAPLGEALLPGFCPEGFDDHHAFAVAYGDGRDRDLGFHADDSELTLNLCLGDSFAGGDLYFEGRRCLLHRQHPTLPQDRVLWTHRPGVALVHAGAHRHGAMPIRSGRRSNLIVWARSSAVRAGQEELAEAGGCPDWCSLSA